MFSFVKTFSYENASGGAIVPMRARRSGQCLGGDVDGLVREGVGGVFEKSGEVVLHIQSCDGAENGIRKRSPYSGWGTHTCAATSLGNGRKPPSSSSEQ